MLSWLAFEFRQELRSEATRSSGFITFRTSFGVATNGSSEMYPSVTDADHAARTPALPCVYATISCSPMSLRCPRILVAAAGADHSGRRLHAARGAHARLRPPDVRELHAVTTCTRTSCPARAHPVLTPLLEGPPIYRDGGLSSAKLHSKLTSGSHETWAQPARPFRRGSIVARSGALARR